MGDGGSLGLAWFHFGLTLSHLVSLGLTWSHLVHLVSLGLTWSHLVSLGLTWLRLASLGLMASREKGEGPEAKGKRERQQTPSGPGIPPYIQSARGDERNETISRLDSLPQPPIIQGLYVIINDDRHI